MAQYQVIARKYRPQSFQEVLGQSPIVTTLKNAIKNGRLAHAYLFCGSRGTGKTTLARVFAKALNCASPTADGEPCNACPSCKEIASGNSLDVLEIDGASHRGIDDIRQINETVGYASSCGKYKIYIIDEVHMLTKEAFNALLKTLEEPPAKVLFIFATTEPHKVLPTILSRCQRFNLSRIPVADIAQKLRKIADDQNIAIEDEALNLMAQRADGGLRDAESLFDQIIAFNEGLIKSDAVADVLGIMPKDSLFTLDQAGKEGRLATAFEIAHQVFSQGKDIIQFVESMTEHFRTLLLIKLSGIDAPFLTLSEIDKSRYLTSSKIYTQEQCLTILDFLIEAQNQIRFQPSSKIALETILLRVMRIHQRLPIEFLVKRLAELENTIGSSPAAPTPETQDLPPPQNRQQHTPQPIAQQQQQQTPIPPEPQRHITPPPPPALPPIPPAPPAIARSNDHSLSIDPTPSPEDLGIKKQPAKNKTPPMPPMKNYPSEVFAPPPPQITEPPPPPAVVSKQPSTPTVIQAPIPQEKQSRYDTLLQFAAVELEGTIQKNHIKH